ncbi:ras-GEF domain-containing family member 1B isoform X2 [Tribolium castaneum]|uniref:ras-GEF domain-containing family member 1B isoform X2 n=1 Tax=Tribolium castaneum TaxID=7070 RepID=UPI00077D9DBE|nr:PREDICTED: ras-GEF domain-containing family member 1B isoform X2 [Tribolium castaneum]|eukprot:XP_015833510.1 PREDICTED: ras-GEF domain-containing family member 1B isoform X2 [Tribolium castaneum]
MQECSKPEKPKIIGPKPSIPSKPKIVPPVNVRGQRVVKGNERCLVSDSRRASLSEHKPKEIPKEVSRSLSQTEKREVFSTRTSQSLHPKSASVETNVKYDEYSATYISEKCDTHTSFEAYKKIEEVTQKAPNSPSTVCCSILSNVTTDCCGIINVNKKELNGKTMTKIDSLDSNSSDSGGFKDFIQLDLVKAEPQVPCHQRKASQPEFLADKAFGHQRKASQPDHLAPFAHNKQTFVANAQALAQFLPQTEQKLLQHRPDDSFRQQIAKFSAVQKTDDTKARPIPQIISQSQFQQSTRKLEELLSQRLEKDKVIRKGQNCLLDGESSSQDVEQKMMVQKQMQQKLQADLQQTVKQIQEIQSIELRLPQNRKWSESNRSQPAIGLKHTPKSRPTIFGTVASDLTPKDCSNRRALVYRDGNLLSGSLEALIQHMVPTDVYYPDRAYLFAFLLSSRLFIKPHDLLARVRSLCETQQGLGSANGGASHPGQARFAEHLVQLLAEWTETFPYDFRDERVMQHVRTITQQCCAINPSIRGNVSSLLHNLLQRLTALEQYEKTLDLSAQPQDENCTDISEVCPVPAVLAQQLTHVELERLSFIGPEEFVQAFAKENPHLETSFKDMKKTHNLEQYVQWFNRLSYFVATQVCKYQKKKQRVRVVEYWIETGRECFNIGNFNSLMAIIAGLNMSPISRLKKTWNKIHSGKFAILEHQMDPSSNFSSYRSTLKAAMWRSHGAKDQRQRIVIPFFSLLVKDLYFLNQGCSNKLPNGHINFEKFWQLAKQVTEFMAWKQVTCPFEKDPKVISVLQHGPILNENALALASFDCEPPENNQEKERCKTLKADSTAM